MTETHRTTYRSDRVAHVEIHGLAGHAHASLLGGQWVANWSTPEPGGFHVGRQAAASTPEAAAVLAYLSTPAAAGVRCALGRIAV